MMPDTPTAVWEAMVANRNPMPPMMALDRTMELLGCDREVALKALHEAAGQWLHELNVELLGRVNAGNTSTGFTCKHIKEGRLGAAKKETSWLESPVYAKKGDKWDRWMNHRNHCLHLLRELTSGVPA